MKIYLAIKFHEDLSNKALIDNISKCLEKDGHEVKVMARDYEKWGKVKFSPEDLMELTFNIIKESDLLLIEFSEKGVGLGIEAGYAFAKGIPIIVAAKSGSGISTTMRGIVNDVVFYDKIEEIPSKIMCTKTIKERRYRRDITA